MAEHSLTIKATLDTSSVQRELDNINKNIATMDGSSGGTTGGRGGNGLVAPIRQLQHSIDQLNSSIGKLALQSKVSGTQTLANNIVGNHNYSSTGRGGSGNWKTPWGGWVKENRFARVDTMPLLMMSMMGKQLSQVFSSLGNDLGANVTGLVEDTVSGAAMGALRFGRIGMVIGASVAAFSNVTKALNDFEDRLLKINESIAETNTSIDQTRMDYFKGKAMESIQDRVTEITRGDGKLSEKRKQLMSPLATATTAEEKAYDVQRQALKSMNELQARLNFFKEVHVGAWNEAKNESGFTGWTKRLYGGYGNGLKDVEKEMAEIQRKLKEQQTILDKASSEESHWKSLRQSIQNTIEKYNKTEEKLRAQYEEQMVSLKQQREDILRGIEDTYMQQGTDILDTMGKSGKFMTHTAQASVSQERYAPITKKLDNMQKQLDHLSKIDSKMSKLNQNIGLL